MRLLGDAPLVSIIMNCYNGEKYLREAIDSVIAQTYQNWELIFWDNQSTDNSSSIVGSYKDSRLKYYYSPEHTLLYDGRNRAVKCSRGEFLAFLDVDDYWHPDKLMKQVELFDDGSVGVVYSNYNILDEESGDIRLAYADSLPNGNVAKELIQNYRVGLLTLMIRRSVVCGGVSLFDPDYHIIGDFDCVLRLALNWQFAAVDDALAVYRIHGNNESVRMRRLTIQEKSRWFREMDVYAADFDEDMYLKVKGVNTYYSGVYALLDGDRKTCWECFCGMSWSLHKVKLMVGLLMSHRILERMALKRAL